MDKRKEANLEVKRRIKDALYDLMAEKSFSEITVTDIIQRAGVARASYYRNYHSIEEILETAMRGVIREFEETADYDYTDYICYESVRHAFHFCLRYREHIMQLFQSGFSDMFLRILTEYVEVWAGDMPASSVESYQLYFFTGGLYNTVYKWFENGARESPEEMARMFCGLLQIE